MNCQELKMKYCIDARVDSKRINDKTRMEFYFPPTADGKGGRGGYTAFVPVTEISGWNGKSGDQIASDIAKKLVSSAKWEKRNDGRWQVLVKASGVFGWMIYNSKSDLKPMLKACHYNDKNKKGSEIF